MTLEDKIKELDEYLKRSDELIQEYPSLEKVFTTHAKDLKRALIALEFYSKIYNWKSTEIKIGDGPTINYSSGLVIDSSDYEDCSGWNTTYGWAGKKAREALKEILGNDQTHGNGD